jgi:hypothetical protein
LKEGAVCITTNQDAGAVGVSAAVKAEILECAVGLSQQTSNGVQRGSPPPNLVLLRQSHGVSQQVSLLPTDEVKLPSAFVTEFVDRFAAVMLADTTRDPSDSLERVGYLRNGWSSDTQEPRDPTRCLTSSTA